jgi:prepilin-type processing-associated H-X9-DG protein
LANPTVTTHIKQGPIANSNYLGIFSGLKDADTVNEYFNPKVFNKLQRAAFRFNIGTRMSEMTDGTSKTMVVAEYLTGIPDRNVGCIRGAFFTARAACEFLYVTQTPNSSAPEILWGNNDGCGDRVCNAPQFNLPCIPGDGSQDFASPRSRHPGGVNALLGDGSVRFVTDGIDLTTWRWLGWMADGNPLGEF